MSRSDNYRPSEQQISHHYTCVLCRKTFETDSQSSAPDCCGREMNFSGESYPANSDDWNEQRDPDGEWRERRY